MKKNIKRILNKLPYVKGLYKEHLKYYKNSCFEPGHFYSPITNVDEIKNDEQRIWNELPFRELKEINLNIACQKEFLQKVESYYSSIPFQNIRKDNLRYYYENEYFSYTDAVFLFGMINQVKPKRIIEVGSGFSSALMLDTNSIFFNNEIELNFIEPYPDRLEALVFESESNCKIIQKKVQEIEIDFFRQLEKGDILFIDSSHISKSGSDLNYLLFKVLPNLQDKVYIHFHDIFYPFEYPKEWVYGGRNWNENYLIRAFMMNNEKYSICLFSHYLHLHFPELFERMPLTTKNLGGSLWLLKN
ncbi:MAG: class I SAM-dependent methyltransferase [Lutibacter sp.]